MASYDNKLVNGEKLLYYTQKVKAAIAAADVGKTKIDGTVVTNLLSSSAHPYSSTNRLATIADIASAGGGTVTSVRVQASGGLTSSQSTAQTAALDTTIGIDSSHKLPTTTEWNSKADKNTNYSAIGANNEVSVDNTGNVNVGNASTDSVRIGVNIAGDVVLQNLSQPVNNNDATTKSYVDGQIASAIAGLTGFAFEIVQTLPTTGQRTDRIYLMLKTTTQTGNVYTEYAWINGAWETLGDTAINIEILTNAEIDAIWSAA